MKQSEAIERYYANKYVWLDAHEHDYDEANAEIHQSMFISESSYRGFLPFC